MHHDNRGDEEFPYGYIYFSDGENRMRYAALSTSKDSDAWGLPSDAEEDGWPELYIRLARQYVETHLVLPADAWPRYEAAAAAD